MGGGGRVLLPLPFWGRGEDVTGSNALEEVVSEESVMANLRRGGLVWFWFGVGFFAMGCFLV